MTSCGCFEVICAYVPECNGIIAVNREFTGETPVGMTFSTLAGNVGGGCRRRVHRLRKGIPYVKEIHFRRRRA